MNRRMYHRFHVVERLHKPILYICIRQNAKGAWDELQRVHAARDR